MIRIPRSLALFIFIAAMFILSPMAVFAADAQTPPSDMPKVPDVTTPEMPKGMEATTPPDTNTSAPVATMPSPGSFPASGMGNSGKSMVSTPDGGIIVMSGNKISKFDKDLNVTKTVELSE